MITQKIRMMDCQSMTRYHNDRRSATWICSSFPTKIYSIDQSYKEKPVFQTEVHLKSSITLSMNEVQKGESGSLIHIPIDEQTRRHLGKSLRTQAGARGDYFLIEKGRVDSQVGREH
jgi:hypothetical protein